MTILAYRIHSKAVKSHHNLDYFGLVRLLYSLVTAKEKHMRHCYMVFGLLRKKWLFQNFNRRCSGKRSYQGGGGSCLPSLLTLKFNNFISFLIHINKNKEIKQHCRDGNKPMRACGRAKLHVTTYLLARPLT